MLADFSKIQLIIYAVFVCFVAFGISAIIEGYKKVIRSDRALKYEIWALSLVLSGAAVFGLNQLHIFIPLLTYYFHTFIWIDYIFLGAVIFLIQYSVDMKMIKKIVRIAAIQLIRKKLPNLSKEDLSELLKD